MYWKLVQENMPQLEALKIMACILIYFSHWPRADSFHKQFGLVIIGNVKLTKHTCSDSPC